MLLLTGLTLFYTHACRVFLFSIDKYYCYVLGISQAKVTTFGIWQSALNCIGLWRGSKLWQLSWCSLHAVYVIHMSLDPHELMNCQRRRHLTAHKLLVELYCNIQLHGRTKNHLATSCQVVSLSWLPAHSPSRCPTLFISWPFVS